MPTNVNVKVNTVGQVVRGQFNMVEINGYDHNNNRPFKKAFFETKKDGGLTKNAEIANSLQPDEWICITLDDTSYHNVQSIRKIAEPQGGSAAAASAPVGDAPPAYRPAGGGGGGASDKMSKADWAEKDRKKEVSVNRSVALKAAAALFTGKGATKAIVNSLEKLAFRMEAYLALGSFDEQVPANVPAEAPAPPTPPAPEKVYDESTGPEPTDVKVAAGEDDDIPF
jgi:hypothetical protein